METTGMSKYRQSIVCKTKVLIFLAACLCPFQYVFCQDTEKELKLIDSLIRVQPEEALSFAEQCYSERVKSGNESEQLLFLYKYSSYCGTLGKYEKSKSSSIEGIALATRLDKETSIADFSNVLGNAYLSQGRVDSAAFYLIQSAEILKKYGEDMKIGYIYNNISNIYIDDQKFDLALEYLQKSKFHLDKAGGEEFPFYGVIIGNFSRAYIGLDSIEKATATAKRTFELGESSGQVAIQVYGMMAMGDIAFKLNNLTEAENYYTQGYEMAASIDDKYRKAQCALLLGKILKDSYPDKALQYAIEADEYYKNDLPRYRYEIVKTMGDIYENKGNLPKALEYYQLYAELRDSVLSNEYDKNKLELIEKYETSQKNLVIQTQESELAAKKLRILRLTAGLIISLLLMVFLIGYYLTQKRIKEAQINKIMLEQEQKMMMSMIEGEQKERTRLAKEIHDGIANEVAALKMQTELKNLQLHSPLLTEIGEKLTAIHQNIRNAAHALFPKALISGDLPQSVSELCTEYQSIVPIRFEVIGYRPGKTKALELFLYRLIQEALGNAVRHSDAKEIVIDLQDDGHTIEILIKDDGKGLDSGNVEKGLGYLHSRIHELGGKLLVNSDKHTGTSLKISFTYAV
jgi:two-component system, NarL family, sensor kinase